MAEEVSVAGSAFVAQRLPSHRVSTSPDPETPAFIRPQMSSGDTALSAANPYMPGAVNDFQV